MIIYENHRSFFGYEVYKQEDESISFGMHLHNSFELLYVREGEVLLSCDGEEYHVKKGEATLILPNRIHSYKTEGYSKSVLYIFSNSFIPSFYHKVKDKSPKRLTFKLYDTSIFDELDAKESDTYLKKAVFYKIAHLFSRGNTFEERRGRSTDSYEKILSFISNHYREPITARDISRELGYDYHYVSSLIKRGFGRTFRELLNEYRISHAQYLLTTESKPISQIAYECGYESLCSFNRNFKALVGVSPRQVRENMSL